MLKNSYNPNYFSIDDILVSQERIKCTVKTKLDKMGFLDAGCEAEDLESNKEITLPLWYVKELKPNNPYFTIHVPDFYKDIHKAVCIAETTHIELGRLHPHFYEYGRYLAPYDRNNIIGKIIFETIRQRVRHLLDIAKNSSDEANPDHKLEMIENQLYEMGIKTNSLYTDWLQLRSLNIETSNLVEEHNKKRKRDLLSDDEHYSTESKKRTTI